MSDQTQTTWATGEVTPAAGTGPVVGTAIVDSHWLAFGASLQRFDCQASR